MRKIHHYCLVIALLFLFAFMACPAHAFDGEMGWTVQRPTLEIIHSDLYLFGWNVEVDSEIDGDLFVFGGSVHVRGPVHGNVYAAGGNVEVDGPVDGDVDVVGIDAESKSSGRATRLLALDVSQSGTTTGDLLCLGFVVNTEGNIGGDTLLGGMQLNVGGTHVGDLMAYGRGINLTGKILGDTSITTESLTIAPSASLDGDLTYTSAAALVAEGNTRVKGNITHNYPSPRLPRGLRFAWLYLLSHKMFSALWLTVVGLASLTWFPRSSQMVVDTMLHYPWESLGIGAIFCVALPGIAFLLIASLAGIPLGIFLIGIFGTGVYLTRLFGSLYIGERLLGALEHHMPPYWQSLPLGVFLFTLLTSIPLFGFFVSVIVIPLALGAKVLLGWRVYRRMRHRHLA